VETSDKSAKSFLQLAYSISHTGGKSVLIMKKTLWKNNLNFVKGVHMICVSFITNVIIVAEEKKRHYFISPLVRIYKIFYSLSDPFSCHYSRATKA
jgi:hypothetical protein